MYGTPASEAIVAIRSAVIRACDSDSITHGPAIKKGICRQDVLALQRFPWWTSSMKVSQKSSTGNIACAVLQ